MRYQDLFETVDWEWDFSGLGMKLATFHMHEKRYIISFAGSRHISIQFDSPKGQGITGEGDAFTVFSTVSAILLDYISKHHPEVFSFSARKRQPSRVKLYTTIAQRLQKKLPTYTASIEDDGAKDIDFIFTRSLETQ